MSNKSLSWLCAGFVLVGVAQAEPAMTLEVVAAQHAPTVDGELTDWPADAWTTLVLEPAMPDDSDNKLGEIELQLQVSTHGDRVYFALRWPDARADVEYRPWRWRGGKYRREKHRDDMLALRFDMAGTYNECMLADADYTVDTWLWSAGRSNLASYATDMSQTITTRLLENAAEYELDSGKVVYIRRSDDAGEAGFVNTRPDRKTFVGKILPGVELMPAPHGSVMDVMAKGHWQDGYWQLELSRLLDTGHDDDRRFAPAAGILGQVAAFDRANAEHKSVSKPILFRFPAQD